MIRTAEQDRRVRSASRERKSDYNKNMMIRVSLPDHATNEQDGKELRVETRGFPRQEYWSGCHFLLQGIFPTQGSNPCLLHCRWLLYCWATRVAFPVFWCKKKKKASFLKPLAFIHHPIPSAAFETSLIYQVYSCLRLSVYFPSLKTVLMSLFCLWSLLLSSVP